MIVVANYYQLGRSNGRFDQTLKVKVLKPDAKVTRAYVEEINAGSIDSGRFYEVDEKKTKAFHDSKKPKVEKKVKEVEQPKEEN